DVFRAHISLRGGGIASLELPGFPVSLHEPDKAVQILNDDAQLFYVVQGGLLSNNQAPTHDAMYTSPHRTYRLETGADVLEAPLTWESGTGITVKKTYRFFPGRYDIAVEYAIRNNSGEAWTGSAYGQLQRTGSEKKITSGVYTYTGAVISSEERRYEKISFDDMRKENLSRNIVNGWAAIIQHYFVAALIPASAAQEQHYYTLFVDKERTGHNTDRFVIGTTTPRITLAPGDAATIQQTMYIGPKIQGVLEKLAPGLELTVDYGWLWFIAKPLFWCLEKFQSLTGNWGLAIVLVTLMLKILFYNLSAAGYRSMARMRKVQPRLLAIRDRYKDDRARLNKAMMDIYKEEKINPLGGCFPILVQIPVFIALYWVLLESIELRQAPLGLWIQDLSDRDPYFVLPVIMGATMLMQQKLNPAPLDPVQEKVMMLLPFVFTVFFAFFPSGLVLYWVVNNILSIAQQWLITRNIERAGLKS
ncbi:MAG: membrane protein insertase YidC, partial [Gammaproteobacteria bacterium]